MKKIVSFVILALSICGHYAAQARSFSDTIKKYAFDELKQDKYLGSINLEQKKFPAIRSGNMVMKITVDQNGDAIVTTELETTKKEAHHPRLKKSNDKVEAVEYILHNKIEQIIHQDESDHPLINPFQKAFNHFQYELQSKEIVIDEQTTVQRSAKIHEKTMKTMVKTTISKEEIEQLLQDPEWRERISLIQKKKIEAAIALNELKKTQKNT